MFIQKIVLMISSFSSDIDEDDEEDMLAYDCQREVLLFYKYYDPAKRMIYYMGHSIEHIMSKFSKLKAFVYSLIHVHVHVLRVCVCVCNCV